MTDLTPSDTPAVPATSAAPATPAVVTEPVRPKSKGLGVFALILGLLAFIGDIVFFGIAVAGAIGISQSVQGGTFDITTLLAGLGGFVFIGAIVLFGGLIVAILAILLGIIAAVKNRGRGAGITGAVFGFLVTFSHVGVLGAILSSAGAISQLNGLGT